MAWECLVFDTDFYVYVGIEKSRPRKLTNVDKLYVLRNY